MGAGQQLGFGTSRSGHMDRGYRARCAVLVVGGWPEPRIFPEERALGLTVAMGRAIAVQAGEMDSGLEAASCPGLARRIASLVGHGTDTKTPPAILQHL